MLPVWLRPELGVAWARFASDLNANGIKLFATQVSRAAKRSATRDGWHFHATEPDGDAEPPPSPSDTMRAMVSSFFAPTLEVPSCRCCSEKLLGDIVVCPGCGKQVRRMHFVGKAANASDACAVPAGRAKLGPQL